MGSLTPKQVYDLTRASSFNKSFYKVDVCLQYFPSSLALHMDYDNRDTTYESGMFELVKKSTPEFQRSNDKWSHTMRVKYVENILSGFKSEILLYRVGNKYTNAKILDGLQRLTALTDFISGQLTVFSDTSYETVKESNILKSTTVGVRIYDFNSIREVIMFYIDMNENITHSKEDIDRARYYLKNLDSMRP